MSARRGFTIAETLVVAVILGMMLTAVAGALVPLFNAPNRAQAKADTLEPAATGLFVLERDVRESDANGVFACSLPPIVCGSGGPNQVAPALAVPTALGSSDYGTPFNVVQDASTADAGAPDWKGFMVYWQPAGTSVVYRAFEPANNMDGLINTSQPQRAVLAAYASIAVADALATTTPAIVMRSVGSLGASIDTASADVSLHVVATGTAGAQTNTTILDTDVFTRN